MKKDRWTNLMKDDSLELTEEEIKKGWHFCYDWDGLLVGPGMGEYKTCTCNNNMLLSVVKNYTDCNNTEVKGWGKEYWLNNDEAFCTKLLEFEEGKQCSLHYHIIKKELFYVVSGLFELIRIDPTNAKETVDILKSGDFLVINPGIAHQIKCSKGGVILECSTLHKENDSFRVKPGDSQKQKA